MGNGIEARIVGVHEKSPSILLADIGDDDIFQVRSPRPNGGGQNIDRILSFMHVWLQYEMGNSPTIKVHPTDNNDDRVAEMEKVPDVLGIYQTMMSRSPALWIAHGKESEPVEVFKPQSERILLDYNGYGKMLHFSRMMSAEHKRDLINTGHYLNTIDKMPLARQVLWAILDYDQGWMRMHSQGQPTQHDEKDAAVHFHKSYGYPLRMALATLLLRDGILDVHFKPGESHGFWCLETEISYKSTDRMKATHTFAPNHGLRAELSKALAPFDKEREKNNGFYKYIGTANRRW